MQNPGMARRAWADYQTASKALGASIVAPVPSPSPDSLSQPVLERRGRGPGRKPAGELYSVRLPADLLEDYRLLSLAEDCPVSTLIRRALKEYMADQKALGALEQG